MSTTSNRTYISEYNQISKECDMIYHSAALRLGISDCAFWIFYTLSDTERQYTQSEICDSSFMSRQTVNSALKKLEKDGYLTLSRSQEKAGKTISLTEKGVNFFDRYIRPVLRAEENACGMFTEEEKEWFLKTYRLLTERLSQEISRV
ncbi:MAG: winged helix-turn-helix transcriptional regulator [Lachnospiraceae bacterium]|nr:winged helix-turn-helix transcriptional regulator [Lachnospiraceae bacterium]